MSFPKIDLSQRPQKRALDPVTISLGVSIMLATLLFMTYGWRLDSNVQRMQAEIQTQDQAIQNLRSRIPGMQEKARRDARIMGAELAAIKQLKNDPVRYANLLAEVADVIPASCYITSLQIDPGTRSVALSGVSTSVGGAQPLKAIAQTMKNFSGSRYFLEPTLSGATTTTARGGPAWTFSINARYDEQAAFKSPDEIKPRH